MSLAIAYGMKKKAKKMADGGMASNSMAGDPEADKYDAVEDGDDMMMGSGGMVDRIMKARCMSKGGMVANDTSRESADQEPNEFDDLVLRDDLDSSYTGADSGDELGNAAEDMDDRDIVARIMKSRKLKDRMPRPA